MFVFVLILNAIFLFIFMCMLKYESSVKSTKSLNESPKSNKDLKKR
jgi:hypothetical protein